MASYSERPPKILVCIPTHDRPKLLNLCIQSVLEQVRAHPRDVEIVVSDVSRIPRSVRLAQTLVQKLQDNSTGVPIHYYPPGPLPRIESILKGADVDERSAYAALIPEDGHWGAGRNRLALLAAYHTDLTRPTVYIHLDDDMALWDVRNGGKAPRQRDHVGLFLQGLKQAERVGKHGFAPAIHGVPAGQVSLRQLRPGDLDEPDLEKKSLRQHLQNPSAISHWGSAKILSYIGMRTPYRPYGIAEDRFHAQSLGGLHQIEAADANPGVVHLGDDAGSSFSAEQRRSMRLSSGPLKVQTLRAWGRLFDLTARAKYPGRMASGKPV